jgi:two-component system, cell cycle response regulator
MDESTSRLLPARGQERRRCGRLATTGAPSMDEKGATIICGAITPSESADVAPSPMSRPMYLIIVSGGIPGAMIALTPGSTRIGRSRENGVVLQDPSVSRRHATIVADSGGDVWITDLASTNGTFLNGAPLGPHSPQRMHDGDRVQLGGALVVKFVRLDPCDEQFQRELFERTVRDPLTGLYNREFFTEQVAAMAELGASRGLGLAVLMLDIDHFKRVNDTYGHIAGDAVLREVAAVLRESTRNEDLVARYGGEEFIAALPVAAPDHAMARAERIRANLNARRISLPPETPPPAPPLRVTASLGLAFAHPGRPCSPPSLIAAADQCLYMAKNTGRNRVVFRVDPSCALQSADLAKATTPQSTGN